MLPDWYLRLSDSTGPAFAGAWSNADVAVASLLVFSVAYGLAAALARSWLMDVAFAALVAGGIMVTWPVMVALTMAAVVVAVVIGFAHKWIAPERQARIDRDAEAVAAAAVRDFERDLGKR